MTDSETPISIEGQIWINAGERRFGGHGRIRLLSHIAETGSISGAARAMKMSYKAAWDAVNQMNNLAGEPLVVRSVGGKGGGSTRITPRGQQPHSRRGRPPSNPVLQGLPRPTQTARPRW